MLIFQVLFCKLFNKCIELSFVKAAALYGDDGGEDGQVFGALKLFCHDLGSGGGPAAVFHQGDGAVFEAAFCNGMEQVVHEGKNACIVA